MINSAAAIPQICEIHFVPFLANAKFLHIILGIVSTAEFPPLRTFTVEIGQFLFYFHWLLLRSF